MKNKHRTLHVWFTLASVLTILSAQQVTGQDKSTLLTYTHPIYGLKIQYPSDWEAIDSFSNVSANDPSVPKLSLVRIGAGDNGTLGNPMYLDFYINSLDLDPNPNLENYMTDIIKLESDACQQCDFNLIYSSTENVTLAGHPAFQIVYTINTLEEPPKLHKTMIIGSIIGNTLYQAYYRAFVPEYSTYSETAKRMIDSLEINPTL